MFTHVIWKWQLNKEIAEKNKGLPDVYQDLAVAYIRGAKGEKAHYDSAKEILVKLIKNSDPTSKRHWEARYLHLLALKEAKEFTELDATLDALARTAPAADNDKFGMKTKIDAIRALRDKKVDKWDVKGDGEETRAPLPLPELIKAQTAAEKELSLGGS